MGIKIKGLKIRNFRCIGELDLDFTDPDGRPLDLVVLAGPNGCGKTSVLEAILIACRRKQLMVASAADPMKNVTIGARSFEIEASIQIDGTAHSFLWGIDYDSESGHRKKKPVIEEKEPRVVLLHHRLDDMPMSYFSSWRAPKLVGALPITAGKRGRRPSPSEENRLWIVKQTLINKMAHSLFKDRDSGKRVSLSDMARLSPFKGLNSAWQIFYPDRLGRFVIGPESEDADEGFDLFLEEDNGNRVSVDQLSSGEIEILTMAGWFVKNVHSGGIVLIDEPELHMHEEWHCAMMRALRVLLPDTQIIVATHSPEILDSAMSYECFWLLHEGDPRLMPGDKPVIYDNPRQDA